MGLVVDDATIAALIAEPKPPVDHAEFMRRVRAARADSRGSRTAQVTSVGSGGTSFELRVRLNDADPANYSVILSWLRSDDERMILRRHNGASHPHFNELERERVDFVEHVHQATERYQRHAGRRAEHYAIATDRWASVGDALACMLRDASFASPPQDVPLT